VLRNLSRVPTVGVKGAPGKARVISRPLSASFLISPLARPRPHARPISCVRLVQQLAREQPDSAVRATADRHHSPRPKTQPLLNHAGPITEPRRPPRTCSSTPGCRSASCGPRASTALAATVPASGCSSSACSMAGGMCCSPRAAGELTTRRRRSTWPRSMSSVLRIQRPASSTALNTLHSTCPRPRPVQLRAGRATAGYTAARALHESAAFTPTGPFADYPQQIKPLLRRGGSLAEIAA
jgi:hypothetical protein